MGGGVQAADIGHRRQLTHTVLPRDINVCDIGKFIKSLMDN